MALLSYSSYGSGKGESVDKVHEATQIAKEKAPDLQVDGELQADAAIVASVGSLKAPESPVAGKANVLIFPNIDAGNIGYKLVQRLAWLLGRRHRRDGCHHLRSVSSKKGAAVAALHDCLLTERQQFRAGAGAGWKCPHLTRIIARVALQGNEGRQLGG